MAFKKLFSKSPDLNRVQANVEQALNALETPLQHSNLVSTPLFASQDNLINHGLDRNPMGYLAVFLDQNTAVWNGPSAQLNGNYSTFTQINLRTSVTCNAKFIFF